MATGSKLPAYDNGTSGIENINKVITRHIEENKEAKLSFSDVRHLKSKNSTEDK
ncbi:hypothetical Protein YC6258_00156 [Gynuella sunshinyii YC6258]|uniref:Uncharacterized protein n=1 Tax=Gynuella sunshinyii YC6258 TaxID=1445510 RepID=A0A0C5VFQ8_9GAMM|nr:hypothetical Protein YC6258_00156 [Gynuella sunshinyii YC6258]